MQTLIRDLAQQTGQPCLTIIFNTHRHHPENQQDRIVLKNLQTRAEEELERNVEPSAAKSIVQRLEVLAAELDHQFNLDSLLLFVHPEKTEFVRLPIPVQDRIAVSDRFYTRDLYRAEQLKQRYYVLVLSRERVRLIEGEGTKVFRVDPDPFPMDNATLFTTDRQKLSTNKGQDNLIEEFFNRVDKQFLKIWNADRAPLVVCTEERNFFHYEKVADRKNLIIGHLNQNRLDEKVERIIEETWPIARANQQAETEARLGELMEAQNAGNAFSDLNEIWRRAQEGRGRLLFVQDNYFQPALWTNDHFVTVDPGKPFPEESDPDIIDRIIEMTTLTGGEVIFTNEEQLADFQGLGLVGR